MKHSDWQSGTIAPRFTGSYYVMDKRSQVIGFLFFNELTETWFNGDIRVLPFSASNYQISNGHLWQWRGHIDE